MSLPIVGMHFHPPAKSLLTVLPVGTRLMAVPEPENPHDPNAVAVWVETKDIPHHLAPVIDEACGTQGFGEEQIFGEEAWFLGYIPKTIAVFLAPKLAGTPHEGKLALGLTGKPKIDLPIGEEFADII